MQKSKGKKTHLFIKSKNYIPSLNPCDQSRPDANVPFFLTRNNLSGVKIVINPYYWMNEILFSTGKKSFINLHI